MKGYNVNLDMILKPHRIAGEGACMLSHVDLAEERENGGDYTWTVGRNTPHG